MRRLAYYISLMASVLMLVACSNTKNTALTRAMQSFKARYNTYYNGHVAYKEGFEAQEKGNKDNYTEVLPMYMTGNKATLNIGSSNYETAITKCQKTIKQHTITKRPEWNSNKPKKPKDKIWLSQKEYNPFLYKAWFLMADAQFHKGEFFEAATTYAYIQNVYFSHPNIIAKARILEARCYAEMGWNYDVEDLLRRTRRDSLPRKYESIEAAVRADVQIRQKQYADAIPNVEKAIKSVRRGHQKARLYFLLGQLYHKVCEDTKSYKAFNKVIAKNPPYELEFNARIQQTEVFSKGRSKQMIKKLQAMARNPKNKDYLDQVYYAIGNIYLSQNDTLHAIYAYKDGVEKSTRNGLEKGVVLLHLGQLYYEKEEFVKAQDCYSKVIGLIDKDREDYNSINERSKILDELLPHAQAIELQDSLQALARMDSVERMKVIDRIIDELKKKEKEEAKKAAIAENEANRPTQGRDNRPGVNPIQTGRQQTGEWYFYNSAAVASGKAAFQQKWGKRELADNWRRNNKTVLADFNEPEHEGDDLATDSISTDSIGNVEQEQPTDTLDEEAKKRMEYENDPHRPEYYLKDIPFTEEQMEASNALLVDGLFNAGIIYKDEMENFPLAERTFQRILDIFPNFEQRDETFYNMYQLYYRLGRMDEAAIMKDSLVLGYPENKHASLVNDPKFEFKARYGKHIEDSLYQEAYQSYIDDEYQRVVELNDYTGKEYPDGQNRPLFMYLTAMSRLQMGDRAQFLSSLKEIVEKYPQSSVSELAGLYVKGLQEGRLLASGKFDTGSIWERRMGMALGEDSLATDTNFNADKFVEHIFIVAYPSDSIDEDQLLYEVANYNFSNFTVRNFDIEIVKGDGINMLQVKSFQNFDEAFIYLHRLNNDEGMAYKLEGLRTFIISTNNLNLLMKGKSFADYFDFYKHSLGVNAKFIYDENSLDEPTDIPTPEEQEEMEYEDPYDDAEEDEENYIF